MFLTIKLYSCQTELFEIELILHKNMELALNKLQRLICHQTQTTNPSSIEMSLEFLSNSESESSQCA